MDIPESVVTASGASALTGALLEVPARQAGQGAGLPRGAGRLRGGGQGRRLRLPLRRQHRPGGGRPLAWSSTPKALDNVAHAEEGLFICSTDAAAADLEHDPGEGAQPRGGRRLHPQDPRAAVPGHPARGGHQPVLLRHGQHPGALLLGPLQAEGGGHRTRPRTSSACRWPGRSTWSRCRSSTCPSTRRRLVVGGGVAGMTSALGLANQGFEVHLVEKEKDLGGMARRIHYHPGGAGRPGLPART